MLARGDVVVALSNSGETSELVRLLEFIQRMPDPAHCAELMAPTPLGRGTPSHCLDIEGLHQEACHLGLAPTASTTAALALGDALAVALSIRKGFRMEDFAQLHPGGKIGKRLRRIRDLMRAGDAVPQVEAGVSMKDVVYIMSAGRMGITAVVDAERRLIGAISDGDLRRLLERHGPALLDLTAGDCLSRSPKTIDADALATLALAVMEENKITSLFITDDLGVLAGAIHLHDLWETELF